MSTFQIGNVDLVITIVSTEQSIHDEVRVVVRDRTKDALVVGLQMSKEQSDTLGDIFKAAAAL